ncbi:hypothetical protein DH2020_036041 [Rehmannia glutinosa]|uniref:CRC domain-containing protein n=1 Tax=Rehmannia glutinosa TaxID=99300 RepID=A0ABR0V7B6_REHGL
MGDGVEIFEKENNKEEGEVMDTPERSKNCQIATSISKFEESPVFNFLNSLSPIKPVKSIHITQTINPLSFASLPSVFTSPHLTSRRESRFLRRHQLSDPSKPEFSSDDQSTIDAKNVNMAATKQLDEQQENVDPRASDDDSAVGPSEPVVEGSEPENLSTQPGEGSEMMENAEMCDIVNGPSMNNPGEKMDYEHLSGLYRATPKDYNSVNHDSSAPRRLLIDLAQLDIDRVENDVLPVEDACQASGFVANEETNIQSSPKKKRRRVEQARDGETSCKRCNCKKSKCLKLYCECFAAGVYCVEPCACIDCFNKPVHEDTVLATRKQIESRNPLAFAPKVIRGSESISEIGDDSSKTPASARHKRGCNCKRSVAIGMETEVEEDETDMTEKSMLDKSFQKCAIENDLEQNVDSNALPATPLRKKPPRSSFLSIGSSSGLNARQAFGKPGFLQPPPKFDKQFETVREDEMPEFLQEGSSPVSGIKLSSPNRKRVSPPRSIEMSPGLRSSRKLILQSIPSFPSLTPNQ